MFNFLAFCLLLIQLCLQLASHSVVAVLRVFEVKTDLVDVGQCVEVFVVAHHLVRLCKLLLFDRLIQDDFLLKLFIVGLELLVLSTLIQYRLDKLPLHLVLVKQVPRIAVVHVVDIIVNLLIVGFNTALAGFTAAVVLRADFALLSCCRLLFGGFRLGAASLRASAIDVIFIEVFLLLFFFVLFGCNFLGSGFVLCLVFNHLD